MLSDVTEYGINYCNVSGYGIKLDIRESVANPGMF